MNMRNKRRLSAVQKETTPAENSSKHDMTRKKTRASNVAASSVSAHSSPSPETGDENMSINPEENQEEEDPDEKEMKRRQSTWTSDVYDHYLDVQVARDNKGNKLYKNGVLLYAFECKVKGCVKLRKCTDQSTGNLLKHKNACLPLPANPSIENMQKFVGGYTRERMRWLVVAWITGSNRPYSCIEDEGLRDIFKMLYSKVEILASVTVSSDIKTVHEMMKTKLVALLKEHNGAIHIAIDAWSSQKASSYLGLTVQWCPDNSFEITKLTLDMVRAPLSHTGAYLAQQVSTILEEYQLSSKMLGVAGDNASNNDTMTDELDLLLPSWGGRIWHVRCFAHVMNLVEQAFLLPFRDRRKKGDAEITSDDEDNAQAIKRMNAKLDALQDDPDEEDIQYEDGEDLDHQREIAEEIALLDAESVRELGPMKSEREFEAKLMLLKATGLAKRVANSDQVQTAFKDCCSYLERKPLMLKRPVATRWNTHFECLERHLVQKDAVKRLCDHAAYAKFKLDKFVLSDLEWTILEEMKPALELFERVTKHVSQTQTVLVHQVIPIIDKLTGELEDLLQNEDIHIAVRYGAKNALSVLDKYYSKTDEAYIYRIAMMLHPRYKTQYFNVKKWPQDWIDESVRITREIWETKYQNLEDVAMPVQAPQDLDFEWYETAEPIAEDALSYYLRQAPERTCTSPLTYWQGQLTSGLASPQLVRFAKDILSCPATSVDVERLFSLSGKTVTPLRNNLADASIRATVVLNSWMKVPGLTAEKEFCDGLVRGWKRGKARAQHDMDVEVE